MKFIEAIRSAFAPKLRKELTVPAGPHLTHEQTRQHLQQQIANLLTDKARLVRARDMTMGTVPVRFTSKYHRHMWSFYGPGDVDRFMEAVDEDLYNHRKELNELDPHPDFDRMYPHQAEALQPTP